MANIEITNIDRGNVAYADAHYEDDLLTFGGAATVVAGTILARDSTSLKLVPFVKGGVTNENGIPKAVAVGDVEAAGAGDEFIRALVAGKVKKERLIIDADGDGSNVDAAVLDQLRAYGITPVSTDQLSQVDNPQP